MVPPPFPDGSFPPFSYPIDIVKKETVDFFQLRRGEDTGHIFTVTRNQGIKYVDLHVALAIVLFVNTLVSFKRISAGSLANRQLGRARRIRNISA